MSTAKNEPSEKQDFTQCPDWGKGGKFIFDPTTNQRTRVDDSEGQSADPAPTYAQTLPGRADAATGAGSADQTVTAETAQPKKEKTRG